MAVARVVFLLVLLALAVGVGFYAGQKSLGGPEGTSRERSATGFAPEQGLLALPPGDAADAFLAALMVRDPMERMQGMVTVLQSVGPEEAPALLATIEPRLSDFSEIEVGLFLQWWVLHDPVAALAWVQEALPREVNIYARIAIAAWAQSDFEAARDFLAQSPLGTSASSLIALARGGYDGGYPGLDAYAASIPVGALQQAVLYALAKRIAIREGSGAVMAWAQALPDDDPQFKLHAYRRVGKALAVFDSPAGRAWAEQERFGPYGRHLLSMVARNEARGAADPQGTVFWLAELPGAPDLSDAMRDAFAAWLLADPEAAEAWFPEQRRSPWLDAVRIVYAHQMLKTRGFDDALAVADEIQDEEERRRGIAGVVVQWWRKDPVAAELWLATADLDYELLENIRKRTLEKR